MWWITLIILTFSVEGLFCDVTVHLELSQSLAHQGDNVTFICRVTSMPEDGYIFWAKSVLTVNENEHVDLIANGDTKLPPYDRFSKYKLQEASTGDTMYYTMHIHNVTVEETGNYICSYREVEDDVLAFESFEVYDDIEYVRVFLNTTNTEIHDDGISTHADEPLTMEIVVGMSVPVPEVKVFVGDEDMTDSFESHRKLDILCSEGGISKSCPLHYKQEVRLISQAFQFKPEHRGMEMVVSSVVPESGFEVTKKTFPLDIIYSPLFKCLTEWSVRKGETFELVCNICSYPMPKYMYWIIPGALSNITIDPRTFVSNIKYDASYKHLDNEEEYTFEMRLKINNVGERDFIHYYLIGGNELGNNSLTMSLVEDTRPTPESGAADISSRRVTFLGAAVVIIHASTRIN